MRFLIAVSVAAGSFGAVAPHVHADNDDYVLITSGAQQVGGGAALQVEAAFSPPVNERPKADLRALEAEAEIEVVLSKARLHLVRARQALRERDYQTAGTLARQVLDLLRRLPSEVDASVYGLQADGILARVKRAGVDVATDTARAAKPAARGAQSVRGEPVRQASDSLAARAMERPYSDAHTYRPGRARIDVDEVVLEDPNRLAYQEALSHAYRDDELARLVEAQETRLSGSGVVSYPPDWVEKSRRRARYRDGQIARSESWRDDEGREWYVAIYDIHDLIYVPPDFDPDVPLNPVQGLREWTDRTALQNYSFIYRGWPAEIAAGIPLLQYFGGVDPYALRGPKYSVQRQQQIVEMMEAFTTNFDQPPGQIISLPPASEPGFRPTPRPPLP